MPTSTKVSFIIKHQPFTFNTNYAKNFKTYDSVLLREILTVIEWHLEALR